MTRRSIEFVHVGPCDGLQNERATSVPLSATNAFSSNQVAR